MTGLQSLLEDYRNWTKTQDWKLQKQREEMFGGDYELAEGIDKWGGGFNPSNIGSGLSGLAGAINTYHGNPRAELFEKFLDKYIRTGVYGKGHYFAENPKEAKKYTELKGPMFEEGIPKRSIYEISLEWPDAAKELADPLSPEHFFQFGKSLQQQPKNIRQWMEEIAHENPHIADEYIELLEKAGSKGWTLQDLLYKRPEMLIKYGDDLEPLMYEKGIPGVRFQDQVSAGKKNPTKNYVTFNSDIPKIISHNNPSVLDMLWPKK